MVHGHSLPVWACAEAGLVLQRDKEGLCEVPELTAEETCSWRNQVHSQQDGMDGPVTQENAFV